MAREFLLRNAPPYKDGEPHIDHAQFMANFNSSKSGIALNLATDGRREIAHELIEWADVVAESFTPGTMKQLGLDWETSSAGAPWQISLVDRPRGRTRAAGSGGRVSRPPSVISSIIWALTSRTFSKCGMFHAGSVAYLAKPPPRWS